MQQLVAAKSWLAKRDQSIPCLELVSAHMVTNVLVNICSALPKEPSPLMFAWLNSTVALHWIVGNRTYKQFVANRVAKIQAHPSINWHSQPSTTQLISQVEAGQFHHYPSGGQVQNGFRIPQHGQVIQSHNIQQHPKPKLFAKYFV